MRQAILMEMVNHKMTRIITRLHLISINHHHHHPHEERTDRQCVGKDSLRRHRRIRLLIMTIHRRRHIEKTDRYRQDVNGQLYPLLRHHRPMKSHLVVWRRLEDKKTIHMLVSNGHRRTTAIPTRQVMITDRPRLYLMKTDMKGPDQGHNHHHYHQ